MGVNANSKTVGALSGKSIFEYLRTKPRQSHVVSHDNNAFDFSALCFSVYGNLFTKSHDDAPKSHSAAHDFLISHFFQWPFMRSNYILINSENMIR